MLKKVKHKTFCHVSTHIQGHFDLLRKGRDLPLHMGSQQSSSGFYKLLPLWSAPYFCTDACNWRKYFKRLVSNTNGTWCRTGGERIPRFPFSPF